MHRAIAVFFLAACLQACGTVKGTAGGFFEGAADDMKSVGGWSKK